MGCYDEMTVCGLPTSWRLGANCAIVLFKLLRFGGVLSVYYECRKHAGPQLPRKFLETFEIETV